MLIYKFVSLEEALDAALQLFTQVDPRRSDSQEDARLPSPRIQNVNEEDGEGFLPELQSPAKRAMARQLMTEFPECDREELIKAVRRSRNVDDAADFLFDGAGQTDTGALELSVKSEGTEDSANSEQSSFQAENQTTTPSPLSTSTLQLRPVDGVIPSFCIRTRTAAEDIAASPKKAFVFIPEARTRGSAGPSPASGTTVGDMTRSYEPLTPTIKSRLKRATKVTIPTDDYDDVGIISNSTVNTKADEEPTAPRVSLAGSSSNSAFDSTSSKDDIEDDDDDIQITDAANGEYKDDDAKVAYLLELFPDVSSTELANELLIQGGNVQDTADQLLSERVKKQHRNIEDSRGSFEDQNQDNEQEETKTGPSNIAKPSQLKRPAGEKLEGFTPLKKSRMNETKSHLPSASEWVRKIYDAQGKIQAVFDNGVKHPCTFPKSVIQNFTALQKELAALSAESAEPSISVPGIDSATWDLAIQWIVCSDIQVDTTQCMTGADELSAILKLIKFAVKLGLDLHLTSPTSSIMLRIKKILTASRDSLRARHVNFAYSLPRGHPLREIFVKATFRPWLEFRYHPTDDSDDGGSDPQLEGENTATQSFFGKKGFWLNKVLKGSNAVYAFRNELVELFTNAWHRREVPDPPLKKKGPKKTETRIKDPFTDEFFVAI